MSSHEWWASLKHGGLLIAPSKLAEFFPDEPKPLPTYLAEQLRRDLTKLEAETAEAERAFLDTVLEQVCGLGVRWEKGSQVDTRWSHRASTGEVIKPRRVWYGPHEAILAVFISDEARVGIGRGRRDASRVVEWLRQSGQKVALLTNCRQWRLVHAGLDYEAFAEWDSSLWFEEGLPSPQVTALQVLLSPQALTPSQAKEPALLINAILASRRGQAELSAELGERVRRAVERLIQAHGPAFEALGDKVSPRDIYLAATRVIMRMVVVLFAEARDLLPRENPIYHASYGLQGLRELLDRFTGDAAIDRLRHRYGAWPRILGLFRLVYEGSHHQALPVPRYGGDLFAPGDSTATESLRRALAVFENAHHDHQPSDAAVQEILGLLCRSRVKVRQGQGSTWIDAPVDFSDLSSEYIGILYEGLLDYELRRVEADDPIVFLRLGDEPALPLSRLEAMEDRTLESLVAKLKVKKQAVSSAEEEGEEEEPEEDEERSEEDESETEVPLQAAAGEADTETDDAHYQARDRAKTWARRAIVAGKLVPRPRGRRADTQRIYDETVAQAAEGLIARVVLPGEWFLVRWGGTRKGSGTFYTRPQLAVPTVQRTLRPLAYDAPQGQDGQPDELAAPHKWSPKKPEAILTLKVCDPSMGSGSFLVAALRFLTDALFASLHAHGRIRLQGDQSLVTLAEGQPAQGSLTEELLPCRPDSPDFEPRLRARLKRYIVERCIYGVDLDPLAVELARLSLWIETMDRDLPFEFLDHKLKRGNSLIGCWFDRFRDYPVLAWNREGGDKNHSNGVHFQKDAWTKAIKHMRNGRIKQELAAWITGQRSMLDEVEGRSPEILHDEAHAALEQLHAMPVHETDERARYYQQRIVNNSALNKLKAAFDTWCAIWFWPSDKLDDAPTPRTFESPSAATMKIVLELHELHQFFHWELEFPDVFASTDTGFDAVIGNPPWENLQANLAEFFSNHDPLFRTYGRLESLHEMNRLFMANANLEKDWLSYCSTYKDIANCVKNWFSPFGDETDEGNTFPLGSGSSRLYQLWLAKRSRYVSYAQRTHPFRAQGGGRVFTYKLFLEQALAITRERGYLGLILPGNIYTDHGSSKVRQLLVKQNSWKWLFGFENKEGIFDIHRSFKFGPIILRKGGSTDVLLCAFMRRATSDWEQPEHIAVAYALNHIKRFSPKAFGLLEIRGERDLYVYDKIYQNSYLLGDKGHWNIHFSLEFMMNTSASLFPPVPKWKERGYCRDEYGKWNGPENDIALPLYQGVMIWQFDYAAAAFRYSPEEGVGWGATSSEQKEILSKYLIAQKDVQVNSPASMRFRIGFRDIQNATNQRTMIASAIPSFPCANTVPTLTRGSWMKDLAILPALNSFAFDRIIRAKINQNHLNWFYIEEMPLPRALELNVAPGLFISTLALAAHGKWFAAEWLLARQLFPKEFRVKALKHRWAITAHERLRLRSLIDAVMAELYGLDWNDLSWILRECDHPIERTRDHTFTRSLDPKGFWRVDKELDPELRHTVLTLIAFHDLKQTIAAHGSNREAGIEAFCNHNDGDGWMLPETLRLDDFGLGHDARAKEPQPVRSRLGERFLPWQLEQSVEESWTECERHARNILGEAGFAQLQAELRGEVTLAAESPVAPYKAGNLTLFGDTESRTAKKGRKRT